MGLIVKTLLDHHQVGDVGIGVHYASKVKEILFRTPDPVLAVNIAQVQEVVELEVLVLAVLVAVGVVAIKIPGIPMSQIFDGIKISHLAIVIIILRLLNTILTELLMG